MLGRSIFFGAMCALLSGCVSTQETFTASGRKGHVISCPSGGGIVGAMTNWGTCLHKAGEICGARGYDVLHRSDEPGFSAAVSQYGGGAGTTNNRMMVVECKSAPAPAQAKL